MPKRPIASWYAWLALVVFTAANVALTTIIAGNLANRAIQADHRAREDAAKQSVGAVCRMIAAQEDVYRGSADEIDRKAAQAWHDLGILFQCF